MINDVELEVLIPSEEVACYYKNGQAQITDELEAALIYHSEEFNMETVNSMLSNIAENTENHVLKREIEELLEYQQICMFDFKNNTLGYVYVLNIGDVCEGYFASYDLAKEYALTSAKELWLEETKFEIEKYIIAQNLEVVGELNYPVAGAFHDEKGNVINCWSNLKDVENSTEIKENILDSKRFHNKYFSIVHNFRKGDMVRAIREYIVGRVSVFANDEEFEEYDTTMKYNGEWFDMAIAVEYVDGDGKTMKEYVNPIQLEHIS